MEKRLIQQGDVLFKEVDNVPENLKPVNNTRKGLVTFAEGEVTGHHHSCIMDGVALLEDSKGERWCCVDKEAVVTHQEHGSVTLSPGKYKIGIIREVDPFENEIRRVTD